MPGTLSRLQRRRFAAGGSYDWGGPQALIPGGSKPATPVASGDRTYTPLSDPGDYYTYGQGPEHTFFSGQIQTPPLQPGGAPAPGAPKPSSSSGGVAGTLGDLAQLAGVAKNAGALLQQAGVDNSVTRGMQNPIGALKDAYGNYQLNNNVGSGQYANNALNDAGFGDNFTTPALAGVGAGAGTLGALGGSGAGLTASITPELIGAGEGAIGATTGAGVASGAGTGAGTLGTVGGSSAGAGSAAAAPLGATAAGAAILAAAAAGIYGGDQRGNSLNKSAKNQQARDSLRAYLSTRDSMAGVPTQDYSGPEWLRPDTSSTYGDYFKLPTGLTADQFSQLSLDDQQKYASDWVNATGGNFMTGNVEGSSYDQSGGTQLTQRQKDINKYNQLAGGYQTPAYGSPDYDAIIGSVMGPNAGGGLSHGGSPSGTLGQLSTDPKFLGKVQGPGTGRSDEIPARLSDGEYVMDAETVSMLGDGSSQAGAKKLDAMRAKLRAHKGKVLAKGKFSPNAKDPMHYLGGK